MSSKLLPRVVGYRDPDGQVGGRNPANSVQDAIAKMPYLILEYDDGSREEIRVGRSVIHQLFKLSERRMSPKYEPKTRIVFQPFPTTPEEIKPRWEREDPV